MKNYKILNRTIEMFGIGNLAFVEEYDNLFKMKMIILKHCGGIMYRWDNDEQIMTGNYVNYPSIAKSIFVLCGNYFSLGMKNSDFCSWCDFISGCESIEEISMKMQLRGIGDISMNSN